MTTNRQRVYQALKNDLINGVFKSGETISDRPLAKRYHVSRTPVREALRQLSSEGLVEVVANVGTRVVTLAKEQIVSSYQLMARIQQCGVEQLASGISQETLVALKELNASFAEALTNHDWPQMVRYDRQFHQTLLAHSDNHYISRFADVLTAQLFRYEQARFQKQGFADAALVSEHERVLEKLAAGKVKKAGRLMRRHWLHLVEV